ncbi:hypothetical protein Trydic_g10748 [Trypoxylus dichotomus]
MNNTGRERDELNVKIKRLQRDSGCKHWSKLKPIGEANHDAWPNQSTFRRRPSVVQTLRKGEPHVVVNMEWTILAGQDPEITSIVNMQFAVFKKFI